MGVSVPDEGEMSEGGGEELAPLGSIPVPDLGVVVHAVVRVLLLYADVPLQ